MQPNRLFVLPLLHPRGWFLATTFSVTMSPLWVTPPSWGQTDNLSVSRPSGPSEANLWSNVSQAEAMLSTAATSTQENVSSVKFQPLKIIRLTPREAWFHEGHASELAQASDRARDLLVSTASRSVTPNGPDATGNSPSLLGRQPETTEPNSFFVRFGDLPRPTALQGPARPVTVDPASNTARGFGVGVNLGWANLGGNDQTLTLGIEGGTQSLGGSVDFRQSFDDGSGYGVNFANRRGVEPEFDEGDNDVDTPSGDDPWVHRLGGGVEYFRSLAPDVQAALGISYQRISVRDSLFTSDVEPEDELGNRLTVSDDGQDDLLTLNFVGGWDRRNNPLFPTEGFRLLFGMDQAIPVGDAGILFNRLSANYTHFLPLDLFGFAEGPRTLVLNVQGGTIIGDAPPYEAFSLGGPSSVRGYDSGELGTGRSFIQATAEYRFPMFSLNIFREDIDIGGTLFFDYATDLGSGDTVIGRPAEVRDKPGDGFGYGLGLRALTPFGPMRLEFGINDEGNTEIILNVGDRF